MFFLSKSPSGHPISRQKYLELPVVSYMCQLIELFQIGMPVARKDGRSVTWLPKFLECMDYQSFLGMGLRVRVEPRYHDHHHNDDDDDNRIDHDDYDILP